MNKKKFDIICNFFNKILEENENNVNILSIQALNIHKNHPSYLKIINISNTKFKFIINILITFFSTILFIFYRFLFVLISLKNVSRFKYVKSKILVISHFFFTKIREKNKDMYFSNSFNYLKTKHVIYYINHSSNFKKINRKKFLRSDVNFLDDLKIYINQFISLFYFFKLFINQNDFLKKNLILNIIKNIFKGRTTENLKYDINFQKMINDIKPKYFITTLEGSSHEKIFFKRCKEINKNCKTIGYQHSFILKSQNTLLKNKMKSTFPDYIFTSSKFNYAILKNIKAFKRIKFYNIGKIHNPKINNYKTLSDKRNICLLAPEGIYDQAMNMLDFIKNINFGNNVKFLLRLHPDLFKKKKIIINYLENNQNKYFRVQLSENKLVDDLKKAKFGLYSGSSMVFTFMQNNVYPIFLETSLSNNEINPIEMINNAKYKKINNIDQLKKIFESKINIKDLKNNLRLGNNYFSDFDLKKFNNFFS